MDQQSPIVCRCEEVTLEEINQTINTYQCSAREVKLRTRAAMGCCGGRTCRHMVDQIIQTYNENHFSDEISLSYRPPVRPVNFADLAELGGDK